MLTRRGRAMASSPNLINNSNGRMLYRGKSLNRVKNHSRKTILGSYRFEDRRIGRPVLVCLMAGKKEGIWPLVLPHLEEAAAGHQVCVISPGTYNRGLSLICEEWGWSYLSTATKNSGLAQDICYRLHREAELIVKVDEDIILLPDSISTIVERYRRINEDGVDSPHGLAPLIPIDRLCYHYVLEWLGLVEAFEMRFGKARNNADTNGITMCPDAAVWIWERTAPLSKTAALLASQPERLLQAPIRYSAGVIVFDRSFWKQAGSSPAFGRSLRFGQNNIGLDAIFISPSSASLSCPVVITSHLLAGRFSFETHYSMMKRKLEMRPQLFSV